TDAKSGSVDGGFVTLVVGGGVGVDNSGGGVNDCNDYGMTEKCTVRSISVCWLGTS
ncbi:hypothetical protein Tco_0539054, partial [Tanacetum coccineum]